MTTAPVRAVSAVSFSRLRTSLLAAASTSLLVALASPANAASCASTSGNDVCVITLGDLADVQNGQAGIDIIRFNDTVNPLAVQASQFGTAAPSTFLNFETAEVTAGTVLSITDGSTTDTAQSLTWNISGTVNLLGAGGDAIGNASAVTLTGTGLLNLVTSETVTSLAGSGNVTVGAGAILSTGAADATFSGVISGAGGISKVGSGKWTLSGNNSYSGPTTVGFGTLEIANAGAIDQSSSVTISANSVLTGTTAYNIGGTVTNNGAFIGNATVAGLVTNNSVVTPGGTVAGAMTFGSYTAGTSAVVTMDVSIDNAAAAPVNGTTHDYIDVTGAVTGTNATRVILTSLDVTDAGVATTGNGIQLIRAGGANTRGQFGQLNSLTAGAYQYLLKYVENYSGTADGYFLQSAVRDELVAQPAMLSINQAMVRDCFRDDQRVPDSPKGATYGRAWIGYRQGSSQFGTDAGIDANADYSCTTGGMDWRMGNGWFGGVSGGFGDVTGEILTPAGTGSLSGSARVIEAFASFTSSALFINLSAGYADTDWTYDGALLLPVKGSVSGFIGSAQTGMALDLDALAVKLIGTLSYDGTNCGDSCLKVGVTEDTGLLEAKGSVRIDGVAFGGSIRPWVAASFSDALSGGTNSVTKSGVKVEADTNSQLLSLDAGLQTYLDQNFALYIDGGYHESLSTDVSGYKAGVGLKMYW